MGHIDPQSKISSSPHGQNTIALLLGLKEYFHCERQRLQSELATNDRQVEAVDFLIESVKSKADAPETEQTNPPAAIVEKSARIISDDDQSADTELVSGVATAKDIAHCSTQREAAYVIAKLNGGVIDLNSAAPLIKEVGLSKGMVSTVLSSLHHFMTHAPQWRYVKPSTFEIVSELEDGPEDVVKSSGTSEMSDISEDVDSSFPMVKELNDTAA